MANQHLVAVEPDVQVSGYGLGVASGPVGVMVLDASYVARRCQPKNTPMIWKLPSWRQYRESLSCGRAGAFGVPVMSGLSKMAHHKLLHAEGKVNCIDEDQRQARCAD